VFSVEVQSASYKKETKQTVLQFHTETKSTYAWRVADREQTFCGLHFEGREIIISL
jgi:hypothetical protein